MIFVTTMQCFVGQTDGFVFLFVIVFVIVFKPGYVFVFVFAITSLFVISMESFAGQPPP